MLGFKRLTPNADSKYEITETLHRPLSSFRGGLSLQVPFTNNAGTLYIKRKSRTKALVEEFQLSGFIHALYKC
jgi:hypothetical protein